MLANITFTITKEHAVIAILVSITGYVLIYNRTAIASEMKKLWNVPAIVLNIVVYTIAIIVVIAEILWKNKLNVFHVGLAMLVIICLEIIL